MILVSLLNIENDYGQLNIEKDYDQSNNENDMVS